MTKESASARRIREQSVIREILSWIIIIILAMAAALIIKNYIIINAIIPSGSMENTIMTHDRIFGFRLAYTDKAPQRGDIIIFKYPDNEEENYVKRIIGLPGETIAIEDAQVYINGSPVPLEESYLKEDWIVATGPFIFEVPEDSYLVLGDNRNNSLDARYWENQYVSADKILGKAIFRYYPVSTAGALY